MNSVGGGGSRWDDDDYRFLYKLGSVIFFFLPRRRRRLCVPEDERRLQSKSVWHTLLFSNVTANNLDVVDSLSRLLLSATVNEKESWAAQWFCRSAICLLLFISSSSWQVATLVRHE